MSDFTLPKRGGWISSDYLELEGEPLVEGDKVLVKWPNGVEEEHILHGELVSLNSEYPDFEYRVWLYTKVKGLKTKVAISKLRMKRLDGSKLEARRAKVDWSKQ